MRTYIFLAILIIIAIFSLWLQEDIKKKPPQDTQQSTHFPDYFMEDFSIINLNKQGQPEYTLKASKMLHYADDNTAELETPHIEFTQAESKFSIQAKRATYLQNKNIIHLYEQVIIHRAPSSKHNELSIHTDYLKIDTQSRIAETDQLARVKTAEAELTTHGLIFNNIQGTLKLQSQVKGVYETTR